MPHKLSEEEIVTLKVLHGKGQSNGAIAQLLGVTEGAVRYPLRRAGVADGRRNKPRKAAAVAAAIEHWLKDHQPFCTQEGGCLTSPPPSLLKNHWRSPGSSSSYGPYRGSCRQGRDLP
jgi:hypothetical protein